MSLTVFQNLFGSLGLVKLADIVPFGKAKHNDSTIPSKFELTKVASSFGLDIYFFL